MTKGKGKWEQGTRWGRGGGGEREREGKARENVVKYTSLEENYNKLFNVKCVNFF